MYVSIRIYSYNAYIHTAGGKARGLRWGLIMKEEGKKVLTKNCKKLSSKRRSNGTKLNKSSVSAQCAGVRKSLLLLL